MKTFLLALVVAGISCSAFADSNVFIQCANNQYNFRLIEPGYNYYSSAVLSSKGGSSKKLECSEMLGRSDHAIWSCAKDGSRTEVTLYGDEYDRQVIAQVTLGKRKIATLSCHVNL